jgi:type 1 glutamine amidotransferase
MMRNRWLLASLSAAVFTGVAAAAESAAKIRVLVITGGHGFERGPFFKLFQDDPGIAFTAAEHAKDSATAYEREDLFSHDVVVLYDMPRDITDRQKAKMLSLFENDIGLVALHHSLVSYQHWPDYERIIGGRYPEEDGKGGAVTKEVGYQHDVEIPVAIAGGDHPLTRGLKDFTIKDEIYWGFRVGPDVKPLLTTTHPKSGKTLAWTRTEGRSRIVYLQLGHGPSAYEDPNYRQLVARSIRWAAEGRTGGKADAGGWISLFDGKSLEGWIQRGGKAKYRAEGGEIIGTSMPNTANSFLCTQREFADFTLELEFKVDPGLNSGVQIRSHAFDEPTQFEWKDKTIKVPAGRVHGLQVEIDPSARAWTAGVYEEGARGWLNDLKDDEGARKAFRAGEWNRFRIECRGDSIRTWLNEVPAADLKDGRVTSGFIALQVHGVGKNEKPLEVRFRGLRLKEI